jgi:hypothetical protein
MMSSKTVKSHIVFVALIILGTYIKVSSETNGDGNVTVFAMVLSTGVIFAFSLFNHFVVDLLNSINEKWRILNYCIPAITVLLLLLVLRIPIELLDIVFFPSWILIANLSMYAIIDKSIETRIR